MFFTESSKADKQIHSRLVSLDRVSVSSGETGEDDQGIVREVTFSTIPAFDAFLRGNRFAIGLHLLIEQSNVQWTVGRVIFSTLVLIGVGVLLGNWWIAPGFIGWIPGLALGTAPYFFLLQKRKKRLQRFSELLPEAIDLMVRGLRSGQAIAATVENVAQESDEPLRSEFRRTADEQSFGLPFRESMLNLSRRVPVPDLQFLVTAVFLPKKNCGGICLLLDKTSHLIRERMRVVGQTRIRTAQGRLTGWILCALPFGMFFATNALNPGYGRILFVDPLGQKMVATAGVLMVVGMLTIRRIVNVRG